MPSTFISYVSEDAEAVTRIATALSEFEVEVWVDKAALKPALRWQEQIRHGISGGDFFLACFSKAYLNRSKTYMNEELTLAIEELRRRPTDRAWFIPVKLNACEVPDRNIGAGETLRSIQWVDLHTNWTAGMERILSVIVPGSERIPQCIAQLDNRSARRRVEAIEALGRMGSLAKIAIPKLLAQIPAEEDARTGLLPLAAISETLKKLGHTDEVTFARINAIFADWRVDVTRACPSKLHSSEEELRRIVGEIRKAIEEYEQLEYRSQQLLESGFQVAFGLFPHDQSLRELGDWWRLVPATRRGPGARYRHSAALEIMRSLEGIVRRRLKLQGG